MILGRGRGGSLWASRAKTGLRVQQGGKIKDLLTVLQATGKVPATHELNIDHKRGRTMVFPDAKVVAKLEYGSTQLDVKYQGLSAWNIGKEEVEAALRTLAEHRRWVPAAVLMVL